MRYINVSLSLECSNSGSSVHWEGLVYFCLSYTPTSIGLQARDQFRVEESWCLARGSLGHRFCHCPQLPLRIPSLPSAPPLCGRPQLRGIPCYPASLMKSDTHPEDLIYTPTGPLPSLFCPHWLWWFTQIRSDENGAVPKRNCSPNHRRGSEGRGNCMESWGPNCLYSWAVWLILGGNERL